MDQLSLQTVAPEAPPASAPPPDADCPSPAAQVAELEPVPSPSLPAEMVPVSLESTPAPPLVAEPEPRLGAASEPCEEEPAPPMLPQESHAAETEQVPDPVLDVPAAAETPRAEATIEGTDEGHREESGTGGETEHPNPMAEEQQTAPVDPAHTPAVDTATQPEALAEDDAALAGSSDSGAPPVPDGDEGKERPTNTPVAEATSTAADSSGQPKKKKKKKKAKKLRRVAHGHGCCRRVPRPMPLLSGREPCPRTRAARRAGVTYEPLPGPTQPRGA
eukprot:scaffold1_cov402-Prasinococcus_capsulatus_cf.AAC.8